MKELELLKKIFDKCDEDKLQSAEDMQNALEEIRDMIKDNCPQATVPPMLLRCPIDETVVEYDEDIDLFKCKECEWTGYYYETIKPYDRHK